MADCKIDDLSDLVVIHPTLDCGNDGDVQADLRQPVERTHLLLQNIRLTAKNPVRLRVEPVELKINRGADFVQLFKKTVILRDALAVRIDHDEGNIAGLRCPDEVDD